MPENDNFILDGDVIHQLLMAAGCNAMVEAGEHPALRMEEPRQIIPGFIHIGNRIPDGEPILVKVRAERCRSN